MTRRMSCLMTVDAVRDRTKTVTRRHVDTWTTLKPGDRLTLIEKGMGLAKGEKQAVLAEVEIVSVRVEPLAAIDNDDVIREGFPEPFCTPTWFASMWLASHGYKLPRYLTNRPLDETVRWVKSTAAETSVRRIEWRYLP